jgi:ketosteroid isomerase-like protein
MTNHPTAEAEALAVLDAWSQALRDKDLDALGRCYAEGVRVFDLATQVTGYPALRALWEGCLPYFPNPIGTERRDIQCLIGEDMAVITFLSRLTGMESDHPAARTWMRTTVGLQRQAGRWRIVHDHISLPVDCGAERPTYILDDEDGDPPMPGGSPCARPDGAC